MENNAVIRERRLSKAEREKIHNGSFFGKLNSTEQ